MAGLLHPGARHVSSLAQSHLFSAVGMRRASLSIAARSPVTGSVKIRVQEPAAPASIRAVSMSIGP